MSVRNFIMPILHEPFEIFELTSLKKLHILSILINYIFKKHP
jgi:hypothetical protein